MKRHFRDRASTTITKSEQILEGHTPQIRALAERLRRLVIETVPNAVETAYPVWHGIGYRHLESGYFCGIFPHKNGVKLGFEYGVFLPDPEGLLQGSGKQVRYIVIKEKKEIRVGAIKRLIRAAIRLPSGRKAKRWVIVPPA
ncbi:MAG: DUF1801 domain-containing protein [Candidatus Manganitrophaceae bacterium]